MIIYIEPHQRQHFKSELLQYFRLRKRVFHDQLGWEVPVDGDIERDSLDEQPCTYTLYLNDKGQVAGGARLIPTTQMTLLEMAFDGLVPQEMSFNSSTIWESSRYCLDDNLNNARMSSGAKRANISIILGNYDYAVQNGISHYISVVERRLFELSKIHNMDGDILGSTTIDGCEVVCAIYPITEKNARTAELMRPLVAHSFINPSPKRTTPS